MKKITTEEFIKRAKEKHGDKFNYSKIVYVNYKTKIELICHRHGNFFKTPGHLLRGQGCPKCTNDKMSNINSKGLKKFIKDANLIHNNKYDYSKSIYKNNKTKLIIVCKKHNEFLQIPDSHLRGRGCPICAKELIAEKFKDKYFVKRAAKIHKGKYDYSKVKYINNNTKVKIVCPIHNIFEQTPSAHLSGQGCKKCSDGTLTTSEFIKKAIEVHGDKYDYSLSKCVGNSSKIKIICKKHGPFFQLVSNHIKGAGCRKCNGYYEKQYSKNNIPLYETYAKQLTAVGVKCRRNKNDKNILQVKCYKCKKWFNPIKSSVIAKCRASKGLVSGELNLYCSDSCKNTCSVFFFNSNRIDPRSKLYKQKTEQEEARSCQTEYLKQLQCDKKGYNYCERCSDVIDVELHHTLEVSKHGKESINPAGHILLCAGCHTELHRGC